MFCNKLNKNKCFVNLFKNIKIERIICGYLSINKRALTSNDQQESFEKYLQSKIKLKGPITVAEYMKEALGNPKWGYYMKKDVFGKEGDFITSPEISQMFGELIGVWYLNEWYLLKELYQEHLPNSIQFIEFGPGRGTLMLDVLRVLKKSQIPSSINVFLIETSHFLRQKQLNNLCNNDSIPNTLETYKYKDSHQINITWLDDINQLPKSESIHFFLANEFFDALPIHKFQKVNDSHKEILIDFDEKIKKFKYIVSPKVTTISKILYRFNEDFQKAEHVEFSIESARIIEAIITRLFEYNGSALFIDYGYYGQSRDTFRAFKSHKLHDPLENVGDSDLTADVDFLFLKNLATRMGASCYGPSIQSDFLLEMQILTRLKTLLAKCKGEEEKKTLLSQYDTLVNKDKMGERFKFLAIRKLDFQQPVPGFSKICS